MSKVAITCLVRFSVTRNSLGLGLWLDTPAVSNHLSQVILSNQSNRNCKTVATITAGTANIISLIV